MNRKVVSNSQYQWPKKQKCKKNYDDKKKTVWRSMQPFQIKTKIIKIKSVLAPTF